jgi:hypothetical protein
MFRITKGRTVNFIQFSAIVLALACLFLPNALDAYFDARGGSDSEQ